MNVLRWFFFLFKWMFCDGFFFTYIDAICSFSGCCSVKWHGIIRKRNDDDNIVCRCFYCCQPVLVYISIGCNQLLKGDCIKSINALSKKKKAVVLSTNTNNSIEFLFSSLFAISFFVCIHITNMEFFLKCQPPFFE